jgi:hypothetical protein
MTKLHEMRLSTMASALREQMQDSTFATMLFEERLGLLNMSAPLDTQCQI